MKTGRDHSLHEDKELPRRSSPGNLPDGQVQLEM